MRYNAIVVLPVFCLVLAFCLRRAVRWRYALAAMALPPLLTYGIDQTIYAAFHVQRTSPERFPLGFELAELCIRCPYASESLPYVSRHLTGKPPPDYTPGCLDDRFLPVSPGYFADLAQLRAEYRRAWRQFPREMLAVKWGNFRLHFIENRCLTVATSNYEGPMRERRTI